MALITEMDQALQREGRVFVEVADGQRKGEKGRVDNQQNGACRVRMARDNSEWWVSTDALTILPKRAASPATGGRSNA